MSLIPRAHAPSGWMSVYVTNSMTDAYIVVGRLETDGIKSWVQQEAAGGAFGLTVGQMGAVQVLVNPEDYDRAMASLAVDYSDDAALDEGEGDDAAEDDD